MFSNTEQQPPCKVYLVKFNLWDNLLCNSYKNTQIVPLRLNLQLTKAGMFSKPMSFYTVIYLGKLESIQVRTTVDEERTMALRPTGGTNGVEASGVSSSSLVRMVS